MSKFLLRQANSTDARGIAQVQVSSWQSTYLGMIPDSYLQSLNVEQRAKSWVKICETPVLCTQTIVAEIDGKIVGFVGVGPSQESNESNFGEIYAIYVDPDNQNQGIGFDLLQQGTQFLVSEGFQSAILWVLDENIQTRNWYESNDWKTNGKTKIDNRYNFELLEIQYQIMF